MKRVTIILSFIAALCAMGLTPVAAQLGREAVPEEVDTLTVDSVGHTFYKCESSGRVYAVYAAPFVYRGMKRADIRYQNKLTGLFCKNGDCYLRPAKVSFLYDINDCTQDSELVLKSDARFLFSNFINYNNRKIPSVHLYEDHIYVDSIYNHTKAMPPNMRFSFTFGKKEYELEAFGEIINNDESEVNNYSLTFSIKGASHRDTIVNMEHINSTFVRLLYIGDLDSDGKPDIILDAPDDYESHHIMLFLSSTVKKENYLRCECEKWDSFDC